MTNSTRRRGWLMLMIGALIFGACIPSSDRPSENAVAYWSDGEISPVDLDAFILEQPPGRRVPPDDVERIDWLEDQVRRLFERRSVLTDEGIAGLAGDEAFEAQVRSMTRTAQANALLARYDHRNVVTRAEAREYYDQHKKDFLRPEKRIFRSLYLAFDNGGDEAARAAVRDRAERLRREALGGASFEALVVANSDSSNAEFGGLVGPVERSDLRGVVGRTVFALDVGEVGPVVTTSGGCLLFQLASLQPASEDRFEDHLSEVVDRMAGERRQEWKDRLVREQAADLGLTSPVLDEDDLGRLDDPTSVVCSAGGNEITFGDVLAAGGNDPLDVRAQKLCEEVILAAALHRENPTTADAIAARVRRNRAHEFLLRRALLADVESWPEEEVRAFFEGNAGRFTTETKVELTVFSWPLGDGDPVEAARAPAAFAEALRRGEGHDLWAREGEVEGVRKENVRLTDLRTLVVKAPWMAARLTGSIEEGQVIGPFRSGPRLWVVVVDTLVPSRPMTYEEARAEIPAAMLALEWRDVFLRWSDHLAESKGLIVLKDRLATFGSSVVSPEPESATAPEDSD